MKICHILPGVNKRNRARISAFKATIFFLSADFLGDKWLLRPALVDPAYLMITPATPILSNKTPIWSFIWARQKNILGFTGMTSTQLKQPHCLSQLCTKIVYGKLGGYHRKWTGLTQSSKQVWLFGKVSSLTFSLQFWQDSLSPVNAFGLAVGQLQGTAPCLSGVPLTGQMWQNGCSKTNFGNVRKWYQCK